MNVFLIYKNGYIFYVTRFYLTKLYNIKMIL